MVEKYSKIFENRMKTFFFKILSLLKERLNIKGLACSSLVFLFLAIISVLFLSHFQIDIASSVMGLESTKIIIKLIGVVGLANWIFVVLLGFAIRSQFDRNLAHATIERLVYILFLVIAIPCVFYLFDCKLPSSSILEGFNRHIINPFFNHGDFSFAKSLVSLVGTFLLSGVLVSMLVNFINQRAERWEKGELRYTFRFWDYCIVIGGHDSVPSLVKQLVNKHKRVIILTNRDIYSFRREVESCLEGSQKERVIFYHGYRNSKEDLKYLHLERNNLKAIYILGESRVHGEEETSHDTLNMTCLDIMNDLRGDGKERIDCYVFFEHQTTSVIFQKFADNKKYLSLNFIPYNFYELQAQKAIGWNYFLKKEKEQEKSLQLDRFGADIVNADKHVHLVIIGMSKMGQALGLEAIRVCHYPNYAQAQMRFEYGHDADSKTSMGNRCTKITFIDCNMKEILDSFKCRYERLLDEIQWKYIMGAIVEDHPLKSNEKTIIPDIELEFVNGRIQSEDVINHLKKISADSSAVLTIFSCLSKSNLSIASILCLPKEVLEKAEIMIYQPDSTKLVESIAINGDSGKVRAFGEISQSVDLEHIVALEKMAKRINFVYDSKDKEQGLKEKIRALEQSNLIESIKTIWKDFATNKNEKECEDKWKDKPETWRWANRYHASAIWQKMHYIDNLDNVVKITIQGITENDGCPQEDFEGLMARTEHNRYCVEQWLLDRKDPSKPAYKNYVSLNKDGDKDENGVKFTEFPTNDQIMTMAIPYIVGDPALNPENGMR